MTAAERHHHSHSSLPTIVFGEGHDRPLSPAPEVEFSGRQCDENRAGCACLPSRYCDNYAGLSGISAIPVRKRKCHAGGQNALKICVVLGVASCVQHRRGLPGHPLFRRNDCARSEQLFSRCGRTIRPPTSQSVAGARNGRLISTSMASGRSARSLWLPSSSKSRNANQGGGNPGRSACGSVDPRKTACGPASARGRSS